MKLYTISEDYIKKLREVDNKVMINKNEKRPYIGIVFEIEQFQYFAPLSSPKNKHLLMKETVDFIKINYGKSGVINLNNMIPVRKKDIKQIDIDCIEDVSYKKLLISQKNFIQKNSSIIQKKANKLYEIAKNRDSMVGKRSCNFKKLEKALLEIEKLEHKRKMKKQRSL